MKNFLIILLHLMILTLSGCSNTSSAPAAENSAPKKILIAYYSHSGTTAAAAREIQKQTGGTLFQIQTKLTYPPNAPGTLAQVKQEYVSQSRPQLKKELPDFSDYDTVILGFPNWFDSPPMGVFTFLENHNWQNKSIYPFVTYGLGGFGSSIEEIHKSAPGAFVGNGLMLHASTARTASTQIASWLQTLNIGKKGDK